MAGVWWVMRRKAQDEPGQTGGDRYITLEPYLRSYGTAVKGGQWEDVLD